MLGLTQLLYEVSKGIKNNMPQNVNIRTGKINTCKCNKISVAARRRASDQAILKSIL